MQIRNSAVYGVQHPEQFKDTVAHLREVVSGATALINKISAAAHACGESTVCVMPSLDFSNLAAPERVENAVPVVSSFKLGTDSCDDKQPSECQGLKNDGAEANSGIQVGPGDILQFDPAFLLIERPSQVLASTQRTSHSACVATRQVFRNENYSCHCTGTVRGGGRDCETCSRQIYDHDECARMEDQWEAVTEYHSAASAFAVYGSTNEAALDELRKGLRLRFTWADSGGLPREAVCLLGELTQVASPGGIMVRMENSEICKLFPAAGAFRPLLRISSVINSTPVNLVSGRLVELWDGRVTERPVASVRRPLSIVAATLSVRH